MSVLDHYKREKERFLEQCVQCGICAEECPILPVMDLEESSSDIQAAVYDSIENETFNRLTYMKAFACMECFKCTTNTCPQDLNPMLINEWIKGVYTSKGLARSPFSDSQGPESSQRILTSVQVSDDEYQRITTPSPEQDVEYVFFPGCNVYFQPEKILNAMDIMDAVGDSYAFLPGLDNCCGDNHLFFGRQEGGSQNASDLVAQLAAYRPKTVILWCPTCHCRFDKYISPSMDLPFKVVSFPQYLAENMAKLPLVDGGARKTVTLHEPCKSAYTGVDLNGARQVLSQLPGVELKEMEHHGADTVCCGSGTVCWFPEACSRVEDSRLREAEQTGADHLVTVCHYCSQTFVLKEAQFNYEVVNYVNLVAESMGIFREDKFKKFAQWQDLDLIVSDLGARIKTAPFPEEKIIEALRSFFLK